MLLKLPLAKKNFNFLSQSGAKKPFKSGLLNEFFFWTIAQVLWEKNGLTLKEGRVKNSLNGKFSFFH